MPNKPRGRPRGSSPNTEADEPVLLRSALLLMRGTVASPTEAFREVIGQDDGAALRRLQRRWERDGDHYIQEIQRAWFDEKWERDARALQHAAPELYVKVKAFSQSEGGAEVLAGIGITQPSRLMSLGIVKLWELIQENSPSGKDAAEKAFVREWANWSRFGTGPDAGFLRRFAQLCQEKADAEENDAASETGKLPGDGEEK